ncbi:MAG TPA: diol dehydratase small subunit [Caldilineaceae bacterium]|nr:diol dehydratase small subunit [Caldilineaceae bacterium]
MRAKGDSNHNRYPLADHPEGLTAASGRALAGIDLDAAISGQLSGADLQISGETLTAQARIARSSGYPQLAENLERAAELSAVPNEELLKMYGMLRPERSSHAELSELADRLEGEFNAPVTAAFVREAAAVYQARKLLRRG